MNRDLKNLLKAAYKQYGPVVTEMVYSAWQAGMLEGSNVISQAAAATRTDYCKLEFDKL